MGPPFFDPFDFRNLFSEHTYMTVQTEKRRKRIKEKVTAKNSG